MNSSVIIQVRPLPVNRLLEIADHAEMARPRTQMSILQPKAFRFRRARRFQQHRKLQRLSVLRFVENDTKAFFADPLCGDRMLQQLFRERDLISVGDESVVESKIAIITLHLRRDAGGGLADPFSQRRKFFLPELSEFGVCRRETNRPAQIFPIAGKAPFPLAQFRLRFADVFVSLSLIRLRVNLSEIERRTGRQSWYLQNSRSRASGELHEIARLHETQKHGPVLIA